MGEFYTLNDFEFENKKVLVRVDFNVPQDEEDGSVTDDFRIRKATPTIKYLLEKGAKQVILISHLGKPKGLVLENFKMDFVVESLESALGGEKVVKLDDCVDIEIPEHAKIVLLENLRFHAGEKQNDDVFAQKLARHADIYVNDAFGTSHREHASVVAITKHLPSAVGLLVQKEVEMLTIQNPERPFVAILGAAKIADKMQLIKNLLERVDKLLLGGAIVFTFLKAKGYEVGRSMQEDEYLKLAEELLENPKIILPKDIIVSNEIREESKHWTVLASEIPEGGIGLDVGEQTINYYSSILSEAKTIFWNGPLGKFETKPYDEATRRLAEFVAGLDANTIVGGGDTANAVRSMGVANKITHVSTGGGASIEMIEGKKLVGITALEENKKMFKSD
ncbi:phosphoglycerate kinase [Candidatus Woesearchaeota archaeon]|nr:phosphoglycerate kinase [Candidatus Woesearchaeota archaeon]